MSADNTNKTMTFIKKLNVFLIVVATVFVLAGTKVSIEAQNEAKHDGSKVSAEIISTESKYENLNFGGKEYYVFANFEIQNDTKFDIYYVEVRTTVYDANDKKIGYLTSKFGTEYQSTSILEVKSKKSIVEECYFTTRDLTDGDVVAEMYNSNFGELTYKSEVVEVRYTDGENWHAENQYN